MLLLLLTVLLAISVLSSFFRIGLGRGTGLAFGGTTFDTVMSTGFSTTTLLSTGLSWIIFFVVWFCPPSDVVMAYQIHKIKDIDNYNK